ncbi:MAG: hypothetical protein KIT69_12100 [Propionibacteriaceae bacterium]|nr:hypothetical protein [Propionibacteriaceae bacterium]
MMARSYASWRCRVEWRPILGGQMRGTRLRSVGGSFLLTLLGVFAFATAPGLRVASSLPACVTELPGTAWLGVQLHILAQSATCPEGMLAPGPHYAEVARISIVLSLGTLAAVLAALAAALGLGVSARRALRNAKQWLGRRLGLGATGALPVWGRAPLAVPVPVRVSHRPATHWSLRGPPVEY